MTGELIARTAVLIAMGTVSVSLWTIRVAMTARGRRLAASVTAGVEAVVFALVFASVLSRLNSPVEVAGYAIGVAAGTLLGVVAESRLSAGQSTVRIIVDGVGDLPALALRARGWPATRLRADGLTGQATVLLVIVDDARLPRLLADLRELVADAFWSVERLQNVKPARLPGGYQEAGRRSRGTVGHRTGRVPPRPVMTLRADTH